MLKIGISVCEFCLPVIFGMLLQPSATLALVTILVAVVVFN